MDFSRLEKNICDVIKEEQIKLGYRREVIRLYYPLSSLNSFLGMDTGVEEMKAVLPGFCAAEEDKLGRIEVTNRGERFCFCLPPEASEYVYNNTPQDGFLYDFIEVVSRHGVTIDEVIDVFKKYSDNVCTEKMQDEDFDYLVYFKDGKPDSFRYCLTQEGEHVIYHRFTESDFRDLFLLWERR